METKINTIDRVLSEDGLSDVCKTVHYSFIKNKTVGEGDKAKTYSASSYGTVGLDAPDSKKFTAYADITEKDVKGWVEAKFKENNIAETKYKDGDNIPQDKKVGDVKTKAFDYLAQIEAGLDAKIAEQETPTKATGKPWS